MLNALRPLALAMLLFGCAEAPAPEVSRRDSDGIEMPPMRTFSAAPAPRATLSNGTIARDFMELTFMLENGQPLRTFTRLEGPITLKVTGRPASNLNADLKQLLKRLRQEAGINIRQVPANADARIVIDVRSRDEIKAATGNAACLVAPNVTSWKDYRQGRGGGWSGITARDRMAIFLPAGRSPQLVLECLHEELAQALGPVNDLYRLDNSVLNDDNMRTVLTGFDMLILRATYDPALRSGMSRDEVAARLPGILDRINPSGRGGGRADLSPTPRAWVDALEASYNSTASLKRRRAAAGKAVAIATAEGWRDNRLGLSLLQYGRMSLRDAPKEALKSFLQAGRLYDNRSTTDIHAATVAVEVSAFMLRGGQPDVAINLIDQNLDAARTGQNAELLATLLMIKAEALEATGRLKEANRVRHESLGWARYGLGSDRRIRNHLAEIAALAPDPA